MEDLQLEVARFKKWAEQYPPSERNGEWECNYDYWRELWAAASAFLSSGGFLSWSQDELEDLLYAIARDNEMERISEELALVEDRLLFVTERAVAIGETDAKWQLAARIGERRLCGGAFQEVLCRLFSDKDEYVKRRALMSLGQIKAPITEEFVEIAWATGHEYQRIACLWALKDAESDQLTSYVKRAKQDGRKYVVQNAAEVCET